MHFPTCLLQHAFKLYNAFIRLVINVLVHSVDEEVQHCEVVDYLAFFHEKQLV